MGWIDTEVNWCLKEIKHYRHSCAVCSKSGTRQRPFLPCAAIEAHGKVATHGKQLLCRVLAKALGKVEHLPWTGKDTRQRVCRVPDKRHTAKVLFADRSMPCAICRVYLGLCRVPWHTANNLCPVVKNDYCLYGYLFLPMHFLVWYLLWSSLHMDDCKSCCFLIVRVVSSS